MAEKKPGSRRGSNPVKPPTIDLKAEKVEEAATASGSKPADAAKSEKTEAPSKPSPSQGATKQADTAAAAKPKPAQEKEKPKAAASVSSGAGQSAKYAGYAGAGALGAVLALVVSYGASFFGSSEPVATVPPELTARLDAIETQLAQAAGQDDTAQLDALRSALEEAQKGSAAARESLGENISGLETSLADLKTRLDAMAASGVDGAPVEAIAGIEAALATLKDEVAALKTAQPAGSGERLDGLEAKVADLETGVAAAGKATKNLESRVNDLSDRVASAASGAGGSGGAQAARVLALADLRDAVARGGSFTAELDALRALVPGETVLEGLDDAAAAGVATRRSLEMEFSQKLSDVLSAARMREDAGVFARLIDNVRGIVTVRPVGAIDGDSPEAVVARIETGLADGDLAGALADWQALPQQARDAAGAWGEALAAKVSVDTAIDELGRSVVSGLKNAS